MACAAVRAPDREAGGRRLLVLYRRETRDEKATYFDGPKTKDETAHGGKRVENIVQAICRDLLVEAMLA
jgi:hypothetical protein